MTEHDDLIQRAADTLKEPVEIDSRLDAMVMAEIRRIPESDIQTTESLFDWLRRRRTLRVSPLAGMAIAAGLAGVVFLAARSLTPTSGVAPSIATAATRDTTVIQFVLVAPGAASVVLVGDFNDWDVSATALARSDGDGVWSVTVPLSRGRYRYSFVVDGTTWLEDPNGAPALEDEFGRPNSVLTVGGA